MTRYVQNLFPTPLGVTNNLLSEEDNNKILDLCKSLDYMQDTDASKSEASYERKILDQVSDIKQTIIKDFQDYIFNLMRVVNTEFAIGSSWATKAQPGTSSNWHKHSNYFYAGVYYPQESSPIEFRTQDLEHYLFQTDGITPYNSRAYTHYPKKNSLVYFKSNMLHRIAENTNNTVRYSVAFNIMPIGEHGFGDSIVYG